MGMILTTYLTRKGNPQGGKPFAPNDYELIKPFYDSVVKSGVKVTVFHDELTEEFTQAHPKLNFVKVAKYPYSANDGRFKIFSDYLRENNSIKTVFFTDLFDVRVNYLPKVTKTKLYIQQEPRWQPQNHKNFFRKNWKWVQNAFNRLYNGQTDYGLIGKSVYNAGIIGGHRDTALSLCDRLLAEFERIDVKEKNGNMMVLNKIIYHDLKEENIVTGYPLTSKFKHYEQDDSVAFNHK